MWPKPPQNTGLRFRSWSRWIRSAKRTERRTPQGALRRTSSTAGFCASCRPRKSSAQRSYESEYRAEFTDDASVVEAVGQAVCLAEGERENLKLTTPGDFVIAEALIAAREEAENEEGTTDAEHV